MRFRTYAEVDGRDRSDLPGQIGEQIARVAGRLKAVRAVIAVTSGKGGVGKSVITAALAESLVERGRRVGVLDADLRSPTVARLLHAAGPVRVHDDGVEPARGLNGIRVMSTDLLLAEGDPLGWRADDGAAHLAGPALENGVLREFLADVRWGGLDVLLLDLPPGADLAGELRWLIPQLTGVLVVTIPSDESRRSVARALRAAERAGVRILGVVENMSSYRCGECGATHALFAGAAGRQLALEASVPLLAKIPFAPDGGSVDRAGLAEPLLRVVEEILV